MAMDCFFESVDKTCELYLQRLRVLDESSRAYIAEVHAVFYLRLVAAQKIAPHLRGLSRS